MKIYAILSLVVFLFLTLFPLVCFVDSDKVNGQENTTSQTYETQAENTEAKEDTITVLRASSGKTEQVDMTEYLIGAVANEMPASFHIEALKAQAVACHTYALWIIKNADNPGSELGDISDNSGKHQGYLNKSEMKEKWGESYEKYYSRISDAVNEVKDQYLEYDGEPILAVFHALSSGTTSNCEDVWGDKIPYLNSVPAPGDKLSAQIDSEKIFTAKQLKEKFGIKEDEKELISSFKAADSGYVNEIIIGGKSYTGREIRRLLDLKSPNFTYEQSKDNYIFSVKGKGHGVGMSQYSADFMARQGSSYKEILNHFYNGAEIKKVS